LEGWEIPNAPTSIPNLKSARSAAASDLVNAQVESVNIVGYQTMSTLPNDYTMIGVNFGAVGGASIPVKDLFTGTFLGGTGLGDADQILVWSVEAGYTGYYYTDFGAGFEEFNNKWFKDGEYTETTDVVQPGQACWLLRKSSAASDVTVAGEVLTSNVVASVEFDLLANDYTMIASPYPVDIPIANGFTVPGLIGGTGLGDADQILVWSVGAGYTGYYYTDFGAGFEEFNNKWFKDGEYTETTDVIPAGAGFWFLNKGAAKTLTIASPI